MAFFVNLQLYSERNSVPDVDRAVARQKGGDVMEGVRLAFHERKLEGKDKRLR